MALKQTIFLVGEPGSGKTHTVRSFLPVGSTPESPLKRVFLHRVGEVCVLGKYEEGEKFAGTDRLDMSVHPHFEEWVRQESPTKLIIEGDRLFNKRIFDFLLSEGHVLKLLQLNTENKIAADRRVERGTKQDPSFIASRSTKIENMVSAYSWETRVQYKFLGQAEALSEMRALL